MKLRKVMNKYHHHISIITAAAALGAILGVPFFAYERACLDTTNNVNTTLFALSVFSVFGFLLTTSFSKAQEQRKLLYYFFMAIRFALAITLFQQAMPQIYGVEFNINYFSLEEKVVNYSPKQFLGLFYAYNPIFQRIFGWSLLAAAVGICFRKTVLLSAFVLLGFFINILILNYVFEFCHLLDTSIILFSIVSILMFYRQRVFNFFFTRKFENEISYPFFDVPNSTYYSLSILKFILIVGYVSLLNNERFEQTERWWFIESPVIQGVWKIDTIQSTKDTIPAFEKFFFEKGRRGVALVENDSISGFQYIIDTTYNQLEFWNFHEYRSLDFKGKYEMVSEDTLEYKGTNQKDSLYMVLSRIPEYDRGKKEED